MVAIILLLLLFNIYLLVWLCWVLVVAPRIFEFRYVGSSSLNRN